MKRLALFLVILGLLVSGRAWATQNNLVAGNFPTTSPYSGLSFVNNVNTAMTVLSSNNAGSSAPSYALSDMVWADTSNNLLKFTPNASTYYPMGAFGNSTWTAISDGVPDDAVTSTGSANAYVVTYSPVPTALFTGHLYKWITNFAVTGSATVNINGLGAKTLKKLGGTNLGTGDLGSAQVVTCVYDGTNCQITSQLATSASGVSSVATSGQVCGGTITTTGTISLCSQTNNTVIANISGSSAAPAATGVPVVTSLGIGSTSAASGTFTGIHSASSNTLALAANGADALTAFTDQGLVAGAATGGDEGAGSINAQALYVNGVAVSTGSSSGLTLLHTQTCTSGSPCSSVVFNNTYFTTACISYLVRVSNFYTSDAGGGGSQSLGVLASSNNGSSYATSYSGNALTGTNGLGAIIGLTQTSAGLIAQADVEISGMNSFSTNPSFTWNGTGPSSGGYTAPGLGSGTTIATGSYNAIKFIDPGGGTMVGTFSLYCYSS